MNSFPGVTPLWYEENFREAKTRPELLFQTDRLKQVSVNLALESRQKYKVFYGLLKTGAQGASSFTTIFTAVSIPDAEPTPKLRLSHIPADHHANALFTFEFESHFA